MQEDSEAPGTRGACKAAEGGTGRCPPCTATGCRAVAASTKQGLGTLNPNPDTLAPGLQVFRTYNASIVLDELLWKAADESETPDEKKADYDRANKEVG